MNLANLKEILKAKEERAEKQKELLSGGGVLVSYTLNIPGPVKTAELYRFVFEEGLDRLQKELEVYPQKTETGRNAAGFFAYIKLNTGKEERQAAKQIKKLTVELEEQEELGRLFDMDVLISGRDGEPEKISRKELGKAERKCLCCNQPAQVCIRAARHAAAEVLMQAIDRILNSGQIRRRILASREGSIPETLPAAVPDSEKKQTWGHPLREKESTMVDAGAKDMDPVVTAALRALLYEVVTTPKPGLVDAENNGAHRDMDITTFFDSAVAMVPYLEACLETGRNNRDRKPEELLKLLTPLGIRAEAAMYRATHGVNTHKGAIFTFGVLCGSCGYLERQTGSKLRGQDTFQPEEKETPGKRSDEFTDRLLNLAGRVCAELDRGNPWFRKEVKSGFPSVRSTMHEQSAAWKTADSSSFGLHNINYDTEYSACTGNENLTGVKSLIRLLSVTEDSNVIRRNGEAKALELRQKAEILVKKYLSPEPEPQNGAESGEKHFVPEKTEAVSAEEREFLEEVTELDRQLIRENSSPGGAADLLAVTYFLRFLQNNPDIITHLW